MIEQFLQTALEFLKEIWFQLNSRFNLENTEAFIFLKPYLIQLQENPLYMSISLAALFLVPYGLIKVRSISKEREQKLDELMEEMGEEEEEFDEFDLEPSESSSDNEERSDLETNIEPVSSLLSESEFDKELNDFMAEELDWKKEGKDIDTDLSLDDSSHDQAIKELQEEGKLMELEDDIPALDDDIPANDPFANYSELDENEQDKAIKDLQDEMERTINQLTQQIEEPSEVPSAIKDLSQIHIGGDSTIDEGYSPEEEEEYFLEDPSEKTPAEKTPEIQSEEPSHTEVSSETPISELSDEEILASLEPQLESSGPETTSEGIPDTHDYVSEVPGFTFEPESDISQNELDIEPKVTSENFTFEPEPIRSEDARELDSGLPSLPNEPEDDYTSLEKTDSLIDRLKFLQTRFENRYQPLEPISSPRPVEKKIPDYDAENLAEPRRYTRAPASAPPDSKKYMDLLESFIFMKDQNKHK